MYTLNVLLAFIRDVTIRDTSFTMQPSIVVEHGYAGGTRIHEYKCEESVTVNHLLILTLVLVL